MKLKIIIAFIIILLTVGATSADVIDDFEDGDIAEYGGDTGSYSIESTTVFEDSYSLDGTASNTDKIISDADKNFSAPVDTSARIRGIIWFTQSESGASSISYYQAYAHSGTGNMELFRINSGSWNSLGQISPSIPSGEWLRIDIT